MQQNIPQFPFYWRTFQISPRKIIRFRNLYGVHVISNDDEWGYKKLHVNLIVYESEVFAARQQKVFIKTVQVADGVRFIYQQLLHIAQFQFSHRLSKSDGQKQTQLYVWCVLMHEHFDVKHEHYNAYKQ